LVLAALAAPGCRRPLADVPDYRPAAPAVRVGARLLACGSPRGDAISFPSSASGEAGVLWSHATGAASPDPNANYVELASDGEYRSFVTKDPSRAVKIEGAAGHRRLFASFAGAAPAAISPEDEDVLSFDRWDRETAGWIVWLARNPNETPIRFARHDGGAFTRTSRIPFDPSRPLLESPQAAPIGFPGEGAFLVSFVASARLEAPREVRVVRVSRDDDGIFRSGPPKLGAAGFAWSRAPRAAAAPAGGILAFEGLEREGLEPALYVVALNAAGDPTGYPRPIANLREGNVIRSRPSPIAVGGRWFVAYQEQRGEGTEPSVFVVPLSPG
jgi:hypothetical protein